MGVFDGVYESLGSLMGHQDAPVDQKSEWTLGRGKG